MRGMGAFWGCFISGRFPFMEQASRLAMKALDFEFVDVDGFTCCPEKSVVLAEGEEVWRLTAARNLAIAEEAGVDLFSPCNGCVGSLKCADQELALAPRLREQTNDRLGEVGHRYDGAVSVVHWIDVLHDRIGLKAVRDRVTTPLSGMRVGVHGGCHQARPSRELQRERPLDPTKFESIVEALGAEPIDYETKLLCCGGTMNTYGRADDALHMTRRKLEDLGEVGADCLATTCPACVMQYDAGQLVMQRAGEETALPAMYLGELMCLAFGLEEEMAAGLSQHRISVQPFVAKWKRLQEGREEAYERFDLSAIETCLECRACADDCAPHLMDPGFDPHEVLEKVRDGRLEEALGDPQIWMCTECYECVERCFQSFGMLKALRTLKQLAIERGLAPKAVRSGLQAFHRSGMLTKAAKGPRQKLGLPDPPATGAKELRKLLSRRERDAPAQRELDLSGRE